MVHSNRVGYRGSERADIHLGYGVTVRPNTLKQTVQGSKNHLQAGRAIRFHASAIGRLRRWASRPVFLREFARSVDPSTGTVSIKITLQDQ